MRNGLRRSRCAWLPALLAAALFVQGTGLANARPGEWKAESAPLDLSTVDVDVLADALAAEIAEDIRRDWSVACDAADFNIYDSDAAKSIQLTVSNKGDCPFTVKVFKSGVAAAEDFAVPAGTPTTINRSNVTKITIDCGNSATHQCKASYTLTEGR